MSKMNFERALDAVLRFEGGYVDHPADPGGATNKGITLATLAAWRGRSVSKQEVRALTRTEAGAIYRARYWDAIRGDDMPGGLDLALFDFAVNSGVLRAVRRLQRILQIKEDGRIGAQTLSGVATTEAATLVRALCEERRAFLKALSTFPVFGRGWLTRIAAIEKQALALAAVGPAHSPPPLQQEKTMDMNKSILASRTLWTNAIGLFALGLSAFGFNTSALDTGALTEQLFQGVAAGSFVVSSLFRVFASKRLV